MIGHGKNYRGNLDNIFSNLNPSSRKHLEIAAKYVVEEKVAFNQVVFYDGEPEYVAYFKEYLGGYSVNTFSTVEFFENKRMLAKAKKMIYNYMKELGIIYISCSDETEKRWIEHCGFKKLMTLSGVEVYKWQNK